MRIGAWGPRRRRTRHAAFQPRHAAQSTRAPVREDVQAQAQVQRRGSGGARASLAARSGHSWRLERRRLREAISTGEDPKRRPQRRREGSCVLEGGEGALGALRAVGWGRTEGEAPRALCSGAGDPRDMSLWWRGLNDELTSIVPPPHLIASQFGVGPPTRSPPATTRSQADADADAAASGAPRRDGDVDAEADAARVWGGASVKSARPRRGIRVVGTAQSPRARPGGICRRRRSGGDRGGARPSERGRSWATRMRGTGGVSEMRRRRWRKGNINCGFGWPLERREHGEVYLRHLAPPTVTVELAWRAFDASDADVAAQTCVRRVDGGAPRPRSHPSAREAAPHRSPVTRAKGRALRCGENCGVVAAIHARAATPTTLASQRIRD
ncbi:hypothetical protein B0H17DRAFT_1151270 [Mycena rosella]|uniref:Uncharacterized protein n=1 Tax=Mycena rosella TaxID=1033263 RepID=A0AAD7BMW0_MYCRO|nr:hypothetical protein B0H17DRAFT_1151270 [Mycena rosella]